MTPVPLHYLPTSSNTNPFRFWDPPFPQYLDIPGAKGRFLGFCAVFIQAAVSSADGYFKSSKPPFHGFETDFGSPVHLFFSELDIVLWDGNSFDHCRRGK